MVENIWSLQSKWMNRCSMLQIDLIWFYAVSAIFQPFNGGRRYMYQVYSSVQKVNYYYAPLTLSYTWKIFREKYYLSENLSHLFPWHFQKKTNWGKYILISLIFIFVNFLFFYIGDSLVYHNGMKFSTRDQDNDKRSGRSCSKDYHGAWWYNNCYYASNLNGKYMGTATNDGKSNTWYYWKNNYESLQITRMMIRPANI